MNEQTALSPLDGRYRQKIEHLSTFFSEEALIQHRICVEIEYFIALSRHKDIGPRALTKKELALLNALKTCSKKDITRVKTIEKKINHDVKAVEYFIKEKLKNTSLAKECEWIHFALTSEDINNCAYALMLSKCTRNEIIPALQQTIKTLTKFARKNSALPMLARTHGQNASPTTVGKEFMVFATRLSTQLDTLKNLTLSAKLNGATGNYNAHMVAYPHINWTAFSKKFVGTLAKESGVKLTTNLLTTQIEPHDSYCELFDIMRRINMIMIDLNQDIWRYISDEWLIQKVNKNEVGSSAMPHKVNPIDFENSEGNCGLANALFTFFSTTLPTSRLQRDLSDSTIERNFGAAFGYSMLAYQSFLKGFGKITVNKKAITNALVANPEIIAEAIQTVLRREGISSPYEKLKELTRGENITMDNIASFISSLDIPQDLKEELLQITPQNYIGLSEKLVKRIF